MNTPMPKKPPRLDPADPVHGFAEEMRRLRLRAREPSLGELARAMTCSHSTISAYLNGHRLPPPKQLESFVLACKGNVADWLERLEAVREQLDRLPITEVPRLATAEPRDDEAGKHAQVMADHPADAAGSEDEQTVGPAKPRSATTQAIGPLYGQIADDLQRKIESGELEPGAQLNTEIELREQYNASRNTVRDAIMLLTRAGLVETRPGHGTFVLRHIDPFVTTLSGSDSTENVSYLSEVQQHGRTPVHSARRVEIQRASSRLAAQLHIARDSRVVSRHQQRSIDGAPWSLQTSFYPWELIRKGASRLTSTEDIAEGTVRYLEHELGIKHVRSRDEIAVRAADPSESAFFLLPHDGRIQVLEVSRTGFDEKGSPIRLTITVYPADRNRLAYET